MPELVDAAPGTTDYSTQLRQAIADAIEDTARRHTSPQPGPMYGTLPTGATMHELADAVLDVVGPELARWKRSAGSTRAPLRIVNIVARRTWYGRRYWTFECSSCVVDGGRFARDAEAIAAAGAHVFHEHGPDVSTEPPRDGGPLTVSQANTGSGGAHQPLPPERPSRGRAEPRYSCTAHPHFATSCPAVIDQHDREAHADDQQRTLHTAPCPAISEGECTCGAMASAMAIAEALPLPRKVCSATRTRSEGGSSDSVHEVCWATYGHDGPHGPWRRRPLPGSFDSGAPRGLLTSLLDDVVRHTPPPDLIRVAPPTEPKLTVRHTSALHLACSDCSHLIHPDLTCEEAAADRAAVQASVDRMLGEAYASPTPVDVGDGAKLGAALLALMRGAAAAKASTQADFDLAPTRDEAAPASTCTAMIRHPGEGTARCALPAGHYDEARKPDFEDDGSPGDPGGWHSSSNPPAEGTRVWCDRADDAIPHGSTRAEGSAPS